MKKKSLNGFSVSLTRLEQEQTDVCLCSKNKTKPLKQGLWTYLRTILQSYSSKVVSLVR